jgi:hypothetical protein
LVGPCLSRDRTGRGGGSATLPKLRFVLCSLARSRARYHHPPSLSRSPTLWLRLSLSRSPAPSPLSFAYSRRLPTTRSPPPPLGGAVGTLLSRLTMMRRALSAVRISHRAHGTTPACRPRSLARPLSAPAGTVPCAPGGPCRAPLRGGT